MDRGLKRRWIKALRSNLYTPGKHYLRRDMLYCPLGVLCNVANPDLWEEWEGGPIYSFGGEICQLPAPMLARIGHPMCDPCITIPEVNRTVAHLSDLDYTFTRIAYLLERSSL